MSAQTLGYVLTAAAVAGGLTVLAQGRVLPGLAGLLLAGTLPSALRFDQPGASPGVLAAAAIAAPLVAAAAATTMAARRPWSVLALSGAALAGPLRSLVYDPFLDPSCVEGCLPSPVALTSRPELAAGLSLLGVAITAAAIGVLTLRAARPSARLALTLVLPAAFAPLLSARSGQLVLLLAATSSVVTLGQSAVATDQATRRTERLARALRGTRIDAVAALRALTGDPTLELYLKRAGLDQFVDVAGRREPPLDIGRVRVDLRQGDAVVGRLHGARVSLDLTALARGLDGPALLAIENGQLAAEVGSRAAELRAARSRIVDQADRDRRMLERDIHDGAQQQVLALGFELRVVMSRLAVSDPRHALAESCLVQTEGALDDLRDLSHGIFPAQLDASGLAAALQSLARRSPVPLSLHMTHEADLTARVERVAYAVIAGALGHTSRSMEVALETAAAELVIRLGTDAPDLGDITPDRVAALGGRLKPEPSGWEVTLPCE